MPSKFLNKHQATKTRLHFKMVKIKSLSGSHSATMHSYIMNLSNLLVLFCIITGLLQQPISQLADALAGSSNLVDASSTLQNHTLASDSSTSSSTVASQLLQDSSILAAIKQFQESNEASLNRSVELAAGPGQIRRPTQSVANGTGSQRKMIRSRYRLRAKGDAPTIRGQFQQSVSQLSNYSQPLDTAQPPSAASSAVNQHYPEQQQHSLARALTGGGVGVTSIGDSSPHVSYASYLTSSSQRDPVVHQAAAVAAAGESGSNGLVLDEPTSYNQESLLDYTPPQAHFQQQSYNLPTASGRMFAQPSATGRAHSMGNPATAASSQTADGLPYFLASPSMNSLDYYGNVNGDHQPSSSADHDHFIPRSMMSNFSSDSFNFDGPPPSYYPTSSSPHHSGHQHHHLPSLSDYVAHYGLPGSGALARNRWSWPWTDASSLGLHSYGPMTAATFKKHYHHMPAQHKEHDHHHHHHEEHDHQMSKWEHGISIGEIACIAIAVVLGVIILGSPFFLLFLMLFNGGNLFGGTQMGLLAPAAAGGAPAAAAGRRRRRRRSVMSSSSANQDQRSELSQEELAARAKELDLHGIGEYLFERLSPFMEPEKLMQSFERMMNVKDDIERIVADLTKVQRPDDHSSKSGGQSKQANQQHVEMRRRRRK